MQTKVCSKCGEERGVERFNKKKGGKFGVTSQCKECIRNYRRQWYQENREYELEYKKKWYQENFDHKKQWQRERYYSNPEFKIADLLRGRTRRLVKQGRAEKFCGYNDYIGCTPQELVQHLESQFYECPSTGKTMTWDNHGEWHIDHIRPLASFDLTKEKEFMQAHHYTNLQPLWAEENLSKGATWDEDRSYC